MPSHSRKLSPHADMVPSTPVKRQALRWHVWLAVVALVLVTFLALHRSIDVPFYLDDNAKIVNNLDIRSLRDLPRTLIYPYDKTHWTFYRNDPSRPLVYLTFALNYHVGKDDPRGYHVVNLVLHLVNALVLFLLLRLAAVRVFRQESVIAPLFGALIFALHPVNAGTVCYAFCRSDLLATGFLLAALLLFQVRGRWAPAAYPLSLVAFALALASKQSAIVLPALALCLAYLFYGDEWRAELKARRWQHFGLWAVALVYLLIRATWFAGIGDMEAEAPPPRDVYLLTQPFALLRYFQMLIAPVGLSFVHGLTMSHSLWETRVIAPLIGVAGLTALTVILARCKTPLSRAVVFFALWTLIALAPTSSFFPTTGALVENRLYLPSLALALLAMVLYLYLQGNSDARRRFALGSTALLLLATFGMVSFHRCTLYCTPRSLWEEVLRYYPKEYLAHTFLGVEDVKQQRFEHAKQEFQLALIENPNDPFLHNNLGMVCLNTKDYDNALTELRTALALDPNYEEAFVNLGCLYDEIGQLENAIAAFENALQMNTRRLMTHEKLAVLYMASGKLDEAERANLNVLRLNPSNFAAYSNLSYIYWRQRRFTDAEQALYAMLEIVPTNVVAYKNLVKLYTETGNTTKRQWAEEKLKALQGQP